MTREQAQQLAANPVWKGFLAGKQVEYLNGNGQWLPEDRITAVHMVDYPDKYRLKPEPRRFWINTYPDPDDLHVHRLRSEADWYAVPGPNGRQECIEVVEVLPQPASQPPAEQPQPASEPPLRKIHLPDDTIALAAGLRAAWEKAWVSVEPGEKPKRIEYVEVRSKGGPQ